MTCASCAMRIEKSSTGSTASRRRQLRHRRRPRDLPRGARPGRARRDGRADGLHRAAAAPGGGHGRRARRVDAPSHDDARRLRQRLVVAAVLTLPVLLLAMVPALRFDGWQWVSLALATPVAVWAAWPFHRAAAVNARHGATRWTRSSASASPPPTVLVACVAARLARPGGAGRLYLEVAVRRHRLVLAGRYAEARARHRSGAALRALLELGARPRRVLPSGPTAAHRAGRAGRAARRRRPRRRAPRRNGAHRRRRRRGPSAVDTVAGHRRAACPSRSAPGAAVVGGTVNASGLLVVRATRVGADTDARPDRPAGHRGAERQGAGAAAGRPRQRRLRARRARASPPSPRSAGCSPGTRPAPR